MQNLVQADRQRKIFVNNYLNCDTIPHPFEYVNKSVMIAKNTHMFPRQEGCICKGKCYKGQKCVCSHKDDPEFLPVFAYNKEGQLYDNNYHKDFDLIYECHQGCSCDPKLCPNRVIQKGSKIPLQLFQTVSGCGWGVRSLEWIPKGTYIAEYVGEILEESIVNNGRRECNEHYKNTYISDLDAFVDPNIDDENGDNNLFVIDARFRGNISRFFNHSCDPNLIVMS